MTALPAWRAIGFTLFGRGVASIGQVITFKYINHQVAALLEKLRIEQTKSRSRQTNDNALAAKVAPAHPGNCSCVVLPSAIHGGRIHARHSRVPAQHKHASTV